MSVQLSAFDRRMCTGREGPAAQLAMRFIIRAAEAMGARRLIDITGAHLIGGFFIGQVGVDLARRLVALKGRVRVATTMTASSIALSQPEFARRDPHATAARELAGLYEQMGARPAWTCAPYHLPGRPRLGQQVAWGESGAVAFANSVLGARTNKYGEPLDVAAAVCGRVPESGLHIAEERAARLVFRLEDFDRALLQEESFYQVLGTMLGREAQTTVAAVVGLPPGLSEDHLAAMLSAAASPGGVELLHVVGVTPEAPTLAAALHGRSPEDVIEITPSQLRRTRQQLSTAHREDRLGTVCIGSPHLSLRELEQLVRLLAGRRVKLPVYAPTCRFVADAARDRGWLKVLDDAGVSVVLDTCTYFGTIVDPARGAVMTNSAKWAHFGPGLLEASVIFASMKECVESAVAGSVRTDDEAWGAERWT